jgi:hypothetical protein
MQDRISQGSTKTSCTARPDSDALVDPLDGGGNRLLPHHDPPEVGGVRLAAARSHTFKLSNDPLFVDKVRDIVGLYLSPPNRALVLSIDAARTTRRFKGSKESSFNRPRAR